MEMEKVLKGINKYDLRLWVYAQSVLAERIPLIKSIISAAQISSTQSSGSAYEGEVNSRDHMKSRGGSTLTCGSQGSQQLKAALLKEVGIFQPPGHKGPLD
jgi:hypothetical protein